ncbi:MAG: SAM-dependent methyltransferase, partial [Pseudomonadota bacterium]
CVFTSSLWRARRRARPGRAPLPLAGRRGSAGGARPCTSQGPALLSRASPVLVMYMAARHLPTIAGRLLKAGRAQDEPVAVLANATMENQTFLRLTLNEAANATDLPTPAVIVVGKVVNYADRFAWFDSAARAGLMG